MHDEGGTIMPMADLDGTRIHYHDAGEGPAIILVTPPLLTKAVFRYQTEGLSDAYRVITFDVRGHGRSERSHAPVDYSRINEDIVRLMDVLGIRKAFVGGYSTGAGVALDALLARPERFYGGIVLSGLPEFGDFYNRARLWAAKRMCNMRTKKVLAWAVCRGNADCPETHDRLFREAMRGDPENWLHYYAASGEYRCTAQLGRIHHPVLLVYGGKDRSFHRYARLLKRELLQAELNMVEGVSHQLPTKAPEAVNGLIRQFAARVLPRVAADRSD
jgi:pimeloyl-ACP methyl ester carboxylesterase